MYNDVGQKEKLKNKLDTNITVSPQRMQKSFYTRYHIAEGRENLEKIIDDTAKDQIQSMGQDLKD